MSIPTDGDGTTALQKVAAFEACAKVLAHLDEEDRVRVLHALAITLDVEEALKERLGE